MSSAKLDVDVYDGDRRVERLVKRPIRLMPDDHAGVVYGGEVYPLKSGDVIDLADMTVEKQLCGRFVAQLAAIPYATRKTRQTRPASATLALEHWYVESNRYGHYLVFDASLPSAKQVVALMDKSGLGVRRWDESVRESANGHSYDWFIRLEFEGSREDCIQRIGTALGSGQLAASPQVPEPTAASAELKQLRREVLELRNESIGTRIASVTAMLENRRLTAKLATKKKAAKRARRQHIDLHDRIEAERAQLRSQVSQLQYQLTVAEVAPTFEAAVDIRLQEVSDAKEEVEGRYCAAQQAAEDWEIKAHQLRDEVESLTFRWQAAAHETSEYLTCWEEAQAELTETRNEARERRSAGQAVGGPPQGSIEAFLSRLLPRSDLDTDSVETLLAWPRPAAALDFLRQVDVRAEPRGKKRLVGKGGWWEVPKVNTGRHGKETAGRIYFAPIKRDRVHVVLHEKQNDKEQRRFVGQLPEYP